MLAAAPTDAGEKLAQSGRPPDHPRLEPAFGITFADLYATDGLARVDSAFVAFLALADAALATRLASAREGPDALSRGDESALLIAIAPHLEDFLAQLFGIEREVAALQHAQHELAPLFACKRQVVQRKAMNKYKLDVALSFDGNALRADLEMEAVAAGLCQAWLANSHSREAVGEWGRDEEAHAADIDLALRYAAWAVQTPAGKAMHKQGVLFKAPRKLDYLRLVPVETERLYDVDAWRLPSDHLRRREWHCAD